MKTKPFYLLLILFITLGACKQETIETKISAIEYYGLEVGNYWIYERSVIDSVQNPDFHHGYDTVRIIATEIYEDKEVYKLEGTLFGAEITKMLYDSAGIIYDLKENEIEFNSNFYALNTYSFTGVNSDTVAIMQSQLLPEIQNITLASGTFDAYIYEIKVYHTDSNEVTDVSSYYVPMVGKIRSQAVYINRGIRIKRDLIEYGNEL